ncbi:astacin-like metalloendopeptidase [Paramacrobiotus metropolitanus]|uniref:astacin-like metalloendopeptidase n=1 Tax=Paramacrobiotus metropolitanus TaxID=2943436 RepID=UPI0024461D39|nr:astacin-like metalloendopeptidase [Paramacrobiotus metropolitanus]
MYCRYSFTRNKALSKLGTMRSSFLCLIFLYHAICDLPKTIVASQLPRNWRDFIDPEILANSNDEFTRYDSDLPEGDILGLQTFELPNEAKNAINDADSFWPNNTIPYEFSKTQYALMRANEVRIILESMQIISHLSANCVNFVKRTNEEDYISIQRGLRCASNIGRIRGKQETLATGKR